MICGVGCRCGSDPTLLWPWRRPVTIAPIEPLAWEPTYAGGSGPRKGKKTKKKCLLMCQPMAPAPKMSRKVQSNKRVHLSSPECPVSIATARCTLTVHQCPLPKPQVPQRPSPSLVWLPGVGQPKCKHRTRPPALSFTATRPSSVAKGAALGNCAGH